MFKYDVIVVGGGHAGIEATLACAKLGCKVLLTSINLDNIGLMPCNPAIGGPSKSNIVREIDALGGIMGIAADATYMQMKTLNTTKGPAIRALRAQSDKKEYKAFMRNILESYENIDLKQCCVSSIIVENGEIKGVTDELNQIYSAPCVILTTGTSLEGRIYIGLESFRAGRLGEFPAIGLSDSLMQNGLTLGKLKTGTPARVDARTINFDVLEKHYGDKELSFFSFEPDRPIRKQYPCHLTRTTKKTHEIILANLDKSPLYAGLIHGRGPRYCPSIEDKVVRFKDHDSHHIFIEPEGKDTYETYVQGFSTSLPADVQIQMLQSLPGLENVKVIKPAYAVEYDYVPAIQLEHSLMTKNIKGLFCAGQINGTSGYEEAAGQGLIAGINATLYLQNKDMITLSRNSSYIGTLIDDLVTKEMDEPYRMLPSRSEYRLILRQDNADERLTELGYKVGLISEERYGRFKNKMQSIKDEKERCKLEKISPTKENNEVLNKYGVTLERGYRIADLLKRPDINYEIIKDVDKATRDLNLPKEVYEQVEIQIKYDGYILRQNAQVEQASKLDKIKFPENIDFMAIEHISSETKEKLNKVQPKTIGQAARIGGIKPADISVLMVLAEAKKLGKKQ
ncbi:MAG: tRNA uridine-5-carboxymethylaminomethyl(34) synthesis enzyme MnmG [Candidatus Gastranaerophilales bacterium]|nr:tRNA uridine-5-carboxymethylaminomethyl(34) synthesis enzyme MnmG [Candidatus Gastranaerophilales bacterium]